MGPISSHSEKAQRIIEYLQKEKLLPEEKIISFTISAGVDTLFRTECVYYPSDEET